MEMPHFSESRAAPQKNSRSRAGCRKCRENKVKCDEQHPQCGRCTRLSHECDYRPRPRKKYTRRTLVACRNSTPASDNLRPLAALSAAIGSSHCSYQLECERLGGGDLSPELNQDNPVEVLLESVSTESAKVLSTYDHATIRYYRLILPSAVDNRPVEHSGPAVVWLLAEKDPMVMHSVCALAGRKYCEREMMTAEEHQERQSVAVEHYTSGLRLLHDALEDENASVDINFILATLWLMISYEQKFGDGSGTGLSTHLQGASSLFQGRLNHIGKLLDTENSLLEPWESNAWPNETPQVQIVSAVTCQLIVWIALIDGGAAINGLGGTFNTLLGHCLFGEDKDTVILRLKAFNALQRRADLRNLEMGNRGYPQSLLVEDLQNSQLFCLEAESGQLRFLLSQMTCVNSSGGLIDMHEQVSHAIRDTGTRYSEFLRTARLLQLVEPQSPNERRFILNVRFVVAFYHAIILCFSQLSIEGRFSTYERYISLREIMVLASNTHKDQGEEAMVQFAWALFVAALETKDVIHRDWILERYEHLAVQGENFHRARNALKIAFQGQDLGSPQVKYGELIMRSDIDRFVI